MPFSVNVNGEILDVTTKLLKDGHYAIYLGRELLGQMVKLRSGWSAVAAKPNPLGVVEGFKLRYKVYEYLLKVRGIDFGTAKRKE